MNYKSSIGYSQFTFVETQSRLTQSNANRGESGSSSSWLIEAQWGGHLSSGIPLLHAGNVSENRRLKLPVLCLGFCQDVTAGY